MKFLRWRKSALCVTTTCVLSAAAWAGGSGFSTDDDTSAEDGPSYFGFVQDTRGAAVGEAKVSITVPAFNGAFVTHSDAVGAYKVPGFGSEVNPNDVAVACQKDGYKQVRVVRRMASSAANATVVEIGCILQRG
jgi:hypothetical protein